VDKAIPVARVSLAVAGLVGCAVRLSGADRRTRSVSLRPGGVGGGVVGEDCSACRVVNTARWFRLRVALVQSSGLGRIVGDGWRSRTARDGATVAVTESGVRDVEIKFRVLHFGGEDRGGAMSLDIP
jgi:hypothetical protein